MNIMLLLSIRIYFPSLTSWLLSKLNSEFGLQLLRRHFPQGRMLSLPHLCATRTAGEVSYGTCSAEHVACDLTSLSPFPQHYINAQTAHVSVHLFWMYIAFCFNLERKNLLCYKSINMLPHDQLINPLSSAAPVSHCWHHTESREGATTCVK